MFNSMHDKTRQARRESGQICTSATINSALTHPSKREITAQLAEAVRNTAALQREETDGETQTG